MIKGELLSFTKYGFIGLVATLLNIFLVWLFIDLIGSDYLMGVSVAVLLVLLVKFYLYVYIELIKNSIIRYFFIQGFSAVLNIGLTWFLLSVVGFSAVIGSFLSVSALFVLRYVLFKTFNQ